MKLDGFTHAGDELTYLGQIIGERLRRVEDKGVDKAAVCYTLEREEQAVPSPIKEYTAFSMKLGRRCHYRRIEWMCSMQR